MVHTFEVYTTISTKQARRILDYLEIPKGIDKFGGAVKVNGIARMSLYSRKELSNSYILKVIVNPAKLFYGYDAFETVVANRSVLQWLSTAFAAAMEEATGEDALLDIDEWFVYRIDYAVDIRLEFPDMYVKLLNKGDKPKLYRDKAQGKIGSCYWECKSTTGNVYDKADQMKNKGKPPELIERARNLLRFEVQCNSPKVGCLRKNHELEGRKLKDLFCSKIAESVLLSYCQRAYKTGDYYTFRAAQARMKHSHVSKRSHKALENVLRAVAQARSISEAREQASEEGVILKNTSPAVKVKYCKEQFGRNCKALKDLKINPVTIPRNWKIDKLPGVYGLLEAVFAAGKEFQEIRVA